MKIAQIAGFLGSGKTSLLMEIAQGLVNNKKKVAIVVNDIGDVPVDGKIIEDFGLKAKELANGCICCQIATDFANTLTILHQEFNPDIVLVEPTGIAVPWMVKRAAEYSEAEEIIKISHAPVITLIDAFRIDMLKKAVKRLIETQVREADVLAINKVDIAPPEKINEAEELAKDINPEARITHTSAVTKEGVDKVVDIILKEESMRYQDKVEEARLKEEYAEQNE